AVDNTDFSTGTQLGLYVADGGREVVEWATDGQAADPAASIGLALLRWGKNRYGAVPEDLRGAQDRWIDAYPVASREVETETKPDWNNLKWGYLANRTVNLPPEFRRWFVQHPWACCRRSKPTGLPTCHIRWQY